MTCRNLLIFANLRTRLVTLSSQQLKISPNGHKSLRQGLTPWNNSLVRMWLIPVRASRLFSRLRPKYSRTKPNRETSTFLDAPRINVTLF